MINFTDLSKDEASLVLNALAQLPFAQVAGLIQKLQGQAQSQLQDEAGAV